MITACAAAYWATVVSQVLYHSNHKMMPIDQEKVKFSRASKKIKKNISNSSYIQHCTRGITQRGFPTELPVRDM